MLINYWKCKYCSYDEAEWIEGEEQARTNGCNHPDNKNRICEIENKWFGDEADCPLLSDDDVDTAS